jgi:hypothetical protein
MNDLLSQIACPEKHNDIIPAFPIRDNSMEQSGDDLDEIVMANA